MRRVAILLLLCFPALAADELAGLARLVGGQWRSEGKLPNGRPVRSRIAATWGSGRSFLRTRAYIVTDKGEYLRYETLTFWHPGEKRIAYVTFSADRTVTRGTVTVTDTMIRYEQPKSGAFPPMRNELVFAKDNPDAYTGTVSWNKDGAWSPVMSAPAHRQGLKAGPALETPIRSGALTPVAALIGRWTLSEGVSAVYEWSLPSCLLEATLLDGGEPKGHTFFFWDPESKGLGCIGLSPGEVVFGRVGHVDGVLELLLDDFKPDGTKSRYKELLKRVDKDNYTWTVAIHQDGLWQVLFDSLEMKREKK